MKLVSGRLGQEGRAEPIGEGEDAGKRETGKDVCGQWR